MGHPRADLMHANVVVRSGLLDAPATARDMGGNQSRDPGCVTSKSDYS